MVAETVLNNPELSQLYIKTCLLNVFHHNTLHFRNLSLHFGKFVDLFRMINTVLHLLFQFWPADFINHTFFRFKFSIHDSNQGIKKWGTQILCLGS